MEKQFIFIPHKIEGEESLPTIANNYYVINKSGGKSVCYWHDLTTAPQYFEVINAIKTHKEYWINSFDFWLEEISCPTDQELAVEIISRYSGNSRGNPISKRAFIDCFNWFKSKLGLK